MQLSLKSGVSDKYRVYVPDQPFAPWANPSYSKLRCYITCRIESADLKNTVKTFSRVMAEEAAKVMGEFGFCPTWGFIQPEPLEDLGQHLSWLFVLQLVRCFFQASIFLHGRSSWRSWRRWGQTRRPQWGMGEIPIYLKNYICLKKEEEEIPKSLKV